MVIIGVSTTRRQTGQTCQGSILNINCLEPPARTKYCRRYEGADRGREEGDVGVDLGSAEESDGGGGGDG